MADYTPSRLVRSFERHLRAENRSERTVENYLESLHQAEVFLRSPGRRLEDAARPARPQPGTRCSAHPGPYPPMTSDQMRATLELLPSWVLAKKAAASRQVIAVMRQRLAASEQAAPMY
jgi:hypothetical protein